MVAIHRERPFESMLIVVHQQEKFWDLRLEAIYKFNVPRFILTNKTRLSYKDFFNSEILTILIMSDKLDEVLMASSVAHTLDGIRQKRILILAQDIVRRNEFLEELSRLCKRYNMTNVLLLFIQSDQELQMQFDVLRPFPAYHWHRNNSIGRSFRYFPNQRLNLANKTLLTFSDQLIGRTFAYNDSHGNQRLNGFVARLVLLFGECFNATIKLSEPLVPDRLLHFKAVSQMAKDGKLDIPMTLNRMDPTLTSVTDFVTLGKMFLMVPCALEFTTQETFGYIFDLDFYLCILIITVIFSIASSLIEWICKEFKHKWQHLLNDNIMRGVLGQAFTPRKSHWNGLKALYVAVGFTGLVMTSQLMGAMNTLLTTPRNHPQIKTFDDLVRSPLKILLPANEKDDLSGAVKLFSKSVIYSTNPAEVFRNRYNFNRTYGYHCITAVWHYFQLQQQYYYRKSFCTSEDLTLFSIIHWVMPLQPNSPYKEAMNGLIHRVHDMGLIAAWHSSTFIDMWRMNKMALKDPKPKVDRKVINAYDLLWIWLIVIAGLTVSFVVFLMELGLKHWKFVKFCKTIKIDI